MPTREKQGLDCPAIVRPITRNQTAIGQGGGLDRDDDGRLDPREGQLPAVRGLADPGVAPSRLTAGLPRAPQ